MDDTTTTTDPIASIDHPGLGESGPTTTLPACPLGRIHPAAWNPRKHFDEEQLAELAADITARGVLQPLVVRPSPVDPGLFELVCGERRFRASARAGLAAVPVVVRWLNDREALEAAISENGQRENLHPLEEADAFLTLHTLHGESVEDIAARFGVSTKLVHQRLTLAKLCDEGRKAFIEGKFVWGVALRIARITSQDYQREAVKYFLEGRPQWQGQLTVGDAARWIENRYHLRLVSAPFDTTDAGLLPGVGACEGCPKNTDAQIPMFGDEVSPGQCMDPVCFARKKERAWTAKAAELAAGREVLTVEQSASLAPSYLGAAWQKGYEEPDAKPREHGGGKKTWRQLLGANLPATVIAQGPDGKPVELIPPDELKAAVKKAGLAKTKVAAKSGGASSGRSAKSWKEQQAEREVLELAQVRVVADAYAKRAAPTDDRAWWQAVVKAVMLNDGHGMKPIAVHLKLDLTKKRKGLAAHDEYGQIIAALTEEIEARSPGGCRELLTLALFVGALEVGGIDPRADALAKVYGLTGEGVTKAARAAVEATKKPAAAEAKPAGKGAGKATAPSKKPVAKKAPAKKARR